MKASDLAAIQARVDVATPGPWILDTAMGCPWNISTATEYVAQALQLTSPATNPGQADRHANAAFIAHSREDIPALLAEVTRLKALVEAAYTEGAHDRAHVGKWDAFWWDVSKSKRLLDGGTDDR